MERLGLARELVEHRKTSEWLLGKRQGASKEAVEKLASAVLAPPIKTLDPRKLGITRDWLEQTAMEGLKKYQKDNQIELSGPEREIFLANFQDKRVLKTALDTALVWHTDNFPEMDVTLTLENGDRLVAGARSQVRVHVAMGNNKSWQVRPDLESRYRPRFREGASSRVHKLQQAERCGNKIQRNLVHQ